MRIAGEERALCCAGCEAAALLITGSGLEDYYRLRAAAGALRGKSEVVFAVVGADDATIRYRQKSSFFAPQ